MVADVQRLPTVPEEKNVKSVRVVDHTSIHQVLSPPIGVSGANSVAEFE